MHTNAPLEMPEWDEETETDFEKFAEAAGISEMPPTPNDWLEEKDDWQAGEGTDPADWPDGVEITLSLQDLEMLVGSLRLPDDHLKVVWAELPWGAPFVRRVRVEGWWEDEEGIESTFARDLVILLWRLQNILFQANGLKPIPAEEFFPLRNWVGWAMAVGS